jgi:ligand-binding sensor domain-containing protein/signal transduction histidine kinase/DNA-binding response OmpR family regulator
VENGLSENTIYCTLQDNRGFMWFGTMDGLNRFDGLNFVIYRNIPKDKNSIGNNFIRSLYEDKNHIIWVGTEDGIYLYDYRYNKFERFDKKTSNGIKIVSVVNSIIADKEGNVWIATPYALFKYNVAQQKLVMYQNDINDEHSLLSNWVWCLHCDSKGIVWVGTYKGGISRYNKQANSFTNYRIAIQTKKYDNCVNRIFENSEGNLVLGTVNQGVVFFDRNTGQSQQLLREISGERFFQIREIFEYSPGVYLIGSERGLIYFEKASQKTIVLKSSSSTQNSLSDNAIYSIYKDREGGIWVGTYFGGINYISPKQNQFEHYLPLEYKNSISGKAMSQFCEDEKGNLWIGTEDGGLNYFNTHTNVFKNYSQKLAYQNIHAIMLDGNKLWIGTFSEGLNVLNLKTGSFTNYSPSSDVNSLIDNNIFSIYKDLNGIIWIGTINGLNKYNPKANNFIRVPEIPRNTHVYDILQDHLGLIWFATYSDGLYCFDSRTDRWTHYFSNPNDPKTIPSNRIISLYLDSKKRLWFGTGGGGLGEYNYETKNFTHYNVSTGLPNNVVYMIVEDRDNLWLSTNKGLVRFNPETNSIKVYTNADGLQSDQFNYKSGLKARNGRIYFGGTNGFNAFFPDKLSENKYIPPIVITNILINNKKVDTNEKGSPIKSNITFSNEIRLDHNQSSISFEFIALSFSIPQKNQYAYKLEGFDKEWNNNGNEHRASYTNLPPGNYTLHIKGSNNDGLWNEKGLEVRIKVLPPFWESNLAYIFYVILLISGSYYSIKRIKSKNQREQQIKLDHLQVEKEVELYNAKIDFFTNIAHEIRTPLSLIKAPLEYIMKKYKDNEMGEYLSVMDRNTNRLIALVNQLLDFRKAEKNSYTVSFKKTNINELIESIYASFKYSTESHKIDFEINLPNEPFYAKADAECITKIITNLLSNAIKHTRNKVIISLIPVTPEIDYYEIQIYDNGEGINESEIDKIFLPFYQIKKYKKQHQGTGIGLALVKLLVEIHSGKVSVESVENEYSKFKIYLPNNQNLIINSIPESQISEQIIESYLKPIEKKHLKSLYNKELQIILIVEDNEELNDFLLQYFKEDYSVMSANNGLEAIKIMESISPDIIVSDIVMPTMDGIEFCKYVKTNILYSHIPLILLTAKTDIKYKIEGLEYGADAYIEKPFSIEHLDAQIFNLIESRQKLKENFINSPIFAIRGIGKNKADEIFLEKINEIIENNITNVDFSVEDLSQKISMSRSNLHRKLKGISGLAPNDFIRLIKLKKAVKFMTEGETRINEICYLVGFNTPSYFAKCFQKQFGILPKDFKKEL